MSSQRILVTGGAGFVGSNLCVALATRHPDWQVLALDNLHRPGSELNLPRLGEAGAQFVEADVRRPEELLALAPVDAIVECSAEPSALAGTTGSPDYLLHTNLLGAYHCLELARRDRARMVFLSTSRVYPVAALESLAFDETDTRFELSADQALPGASAHGVAEDFPLQGARTLYGTTKLAAEQLIAEYAAAFSVEAVIDRCGVIAGPWQMGKVDQGVFTHWALAHHFGLPLSYIGYGGKGKQVRDLLHVEDLVDLIDEQLQEPDAWNGRTVNVGGGRERSLSLLETTELCAELTGRRIEVSASHEERRGDVRIYLSDCARLEAATQWRPQRSARQVLEDILHWIAANEAALTRVLAR